jgi:hypothetical protein
MGSPTPVTGVYVFACGVGITYTLRCRGDQRLYGYLQ